MTETWIVYPCSKKPILKRRGFFYHWPRWEFSTIEEANECIANLNND